MIFARSVVQQLAESGEPGEHPALDRTQGLAEPLRELRLGEAAVVGKLDRLALRVGKLAECRLHSLALEVQPGGLFGRRGRGLLASLGVVERLGSPALLATDEVDRAPVHEREDPRRGLRALGR